ncbi:hypothetical protein K0M31_016041 [Melipona bicolor]|uniref:Uncharacterized protein n=1 Tax=Melipona bicolor TaxID=60889 RepID=A0AA40KT32_9HYME|nr:hypothetical protein K0M31_016041 [Melipona bicolor]
MVKRETGARLEAVDSRRVAVPKRIKRDPSWPGLGNTKHADVSTGSVIWQFQKLSPLSSGGTQFREDNLKITGLTVSLAHILAYPDPAAVSTLPDRRSILNPCHHSNAQ